MMAQAKCRRNTGEHDRFPGHGLISLHSQAADCAKLGPRRVTRQLTDATRRIIAEAARLAREEERWKASSHSSTAGFLAAGGGGEGAGQGRAGLRAAATATAPLASPVFLFCPFLHPQCTDPWALRP